jgi:hypothetical protein
MLLTATLTRDSGLRSPKQYKGDVLKNTDINRRHLLWDHLIEFDD